MPSSTLASASKKYVQHIQLAELILIADRNIARTGQNRTLLEGDKIFTLVLGEKFIPSEVFHPL